MAGSGVPGRRTTPRVAVSSLVSASGCPRRVAARWPASGPRLQAFAIDAAMCALIAWGFWRDPVWSTPIFALEVLVLTTFLGASAGQFLRGLRVVRPDGRPPGLLRSVVRTALLLLLVPALIWDRDGRGLHDKVAGTLLVRVR